MADDNKRQPFQDDTAAQDQQKGGEATADQDVTDVGEDMDVPTDTSEVEEDVTEASSFEDQSDTESEDERQQ